MGWLIPTDIGTAGNMHAACKRGCKAGHAGKGLALAFANLLR